MAPMRRQTATAKLIAPAKGQHWPGSVCSRQPGTGDGRTEISNNCSLICPRGASPCPRMFGAGPLAWGPLKICLSRRIAPRVTALERRVRPGLFPRLPVAPLPNQPAANS